MKGNNRTHGSHETFRGPGSIGSNTTPGLVYKNKKMPGHYGTDRVTTRNLQIVHVDLDKNCLLIHGAVPGAPDGFLEIHPHSTPTT
jgi:large subunit ribosomal protein L3